MFAAGSAEGKSNGKIKLRDGRKWTLDNNLFRQTNARSSCWVETVVASPGTACMRLAGSSEPLVVEGSHGGHEIEQTKQFS